MRVSLPAELRAYVDARVEDGPHDSASDYVCDLIRRDRDRQKLRVTLGHGARSAPGPLADDAFFAGLRNRLSTTD